MRKYLSMMFVLLLAATIGLSACAKKEEPPRRLRLRPPPLPRLPTTWHRPRPQHRLRLKRPRK